MSDSPSIITRRGLLGMFAACAGASILPSGIIMPIRKIIEPLQLALPLALGRMLSSSYRDLKPGDIFTMDHQRDHEGHLVQFIVSDIYGGVSIVLPPKFASTEDYLRSL